MKTVLVLGSNGLFGSHAAAAFAAAGWHVRRYTRGDDMTSAAMGADVIVNALNPPNYHDWARLIPQITDQVIAAGLASGATVLVPGNVYVYGTEPGPWNADTPHRPVSRKGAIRMRMEADYRAAANRGLRTIILRGGDFLAPGSGRSVMDILVLKHLAKGRVTAVGDPSARRAYAYLPDMARAGVALTELRDSLPAFADIPFAGDVFSIEDLTRSLERLSGRNLRIVPFPWLVMRLAAPVWELARELLEMRYLYNLPHALDPAPLRNLLPEFGQTPLDTILGRHLPEAQGKAMSTQTGR